MTPAVRTTGRWSAWAGLLALEGLTARTYLVRGTWWHWLLHVPIGVGVGFAAGALLSLWRPQPVVLWGVVGQLYSMMPDLMFRFLRMPHERSMDSYVGHVSIHRGPSPVLVALLVLLLGGWSFLAVLLGRRHTCVALAVLTVATLLGGCLLAAPLPARLTDFG